VSGWREPRRLVVLPGLTLLAAALAACGHSSASSVSCYGSMDPCVTVRQTDAEPVVELRTGSTWGSILVTNQGFTLYRFAQDSRGVSRCFDGCVQRWPPLLLQPMQRLEAGPGLSSSDLAVIPRPEGGQQVTYRGIPLYVYSLDEAPGDTYGEAAYDGGLWYVVTPSTTTPNQGPPPQAPAPPAGPLPAPASTP
jgi:predicted lipoprotein with Yx(FWY)xxD motif